MRILPWFMIVAVACASGSGSDSGSSTSEAPDPGALEITPGEPFRLAVEEEMRLPSEDLMVRFIGVAGDSRCPKDVTCFWAGDAEVELRLTRGEEESTMSIHTNGGAKFPRSAQAFGCTIRLEDVEPYPKSTSKIAPEDYVVTLMLTVGKSAE